MKRGNLPAYVMGIISVATALASYIYVSDTSTAKTEIKEIQSVNIQQGKDITEVQTDIKYIKESQDKMNAKLDKLLNKF